MVLACGRCALPDRACGHLGAGLVPGQDTPVHAFFARVLRERGLFDGLLEGRFAPTSQLSVYLSVPFASLEPALVGKLTRTLAGGLLLGAMLLCGRETGERRPIGFLLAPALTCAFPQAMGFDNFALGMALGVLTIAATLRALSGRKIWYLLGLMVAGLLLAVAHAVAFGLTAVVAGMLALLLATDQMSTRFARVGLTLIGFLPGGLYAIWATLVVTATQASNGVSEGLGVQRLPLREQVTNLWDVSFGGSPPLGCCLLLSPSRPSSFTSAGVRECPPHPLVCGGGNGGASRALLRGTVSHSWVGLCAAAGAGGAVHAVAALRGLGREVAHLCRPTAYSSRSSSAEASWGRLQWEKRFGLRRRGSVAPGQAW